jgi:hypothetical protein
MAYGTIRFSLKEYSVSDPVTVVFSGAGDSQEVPATYGSGSFTADFALEIDAKDQPSYAYSVSYRMGGETVSSGHIIDIRPGDALRDRIGTKTASSMFDNNTVTVQVGFQNEFGTNEKLKFVSCELRVAIDDVNETIDLMDKIRVDGGSQFLDADDGFTFESADFTQRPDGSGTPPPIMDGEYIIYITATDGYGFEYRF